MIADMKARFRTFCADAELEGRDAAAKMIAHELVTLEDLEKHYRAEQSRLDDLAKQAQSEKHARRTFWLSVGAFALSALSVMWNIINAVAQHR